MKTDTILWLLPVVFMLHDFEEILMIRPWLSRNQAMLEKRLPALAKRALAHTGSLSTNAFALAVAEEFLLLSGLTLLAVERSLYSLWAGMLIAFFLHLVMHIGQFLALRRYVPVIITSIPAAAYSIWALLEINRRALLAWDQVILWSLISLVVLVGNLAFATWLAGVFDRSVNVPNE